MENGLKPDKSIIPLDLRNAAALPAAISGEDYRRWQLELVVEKYLAGYDLNREDRDIKSENEALGKWIKDGYAAQYKDFWGPRVA